MTLLTANQRPCCLLFYLFCPHFSELNFQLRPLQLTLHLKAATCNHPQQLSGHKLTQSDRKIIAERNFSMVAGNRQLLM